MHLHEKIVSRLKLLSRLLKVVLIAGVCTRMMRIQIKEADVFAVKVELGPADRAMTVLFDADLGDIWSLGWLVFVHLVFAVNKHHDVSVLFN